MFPTIRQIPRQSKKGFTIVMLILVGLSGALQFIGLTTPGWIVLKTVLFKGQIGLFYAVICWADTCVTKTYDEFERETSNTGLYGMTEFQIETVTGFICCIVTLVVLLKGSTERTRTGLIATCVVALFSAVLSLVAAGRVGKANMEIHELLLEIQGTSPYSFPYSVLITGLGGVLMGVCVLAMFVKLLLCTRDEEPEYLIQEPQVYSMGPQSGMPYDASQGGIGSTIHVQNTY